MAPEQKPSSSRGVRAARRSAASSSLESNHALLEGLSAPSGENFFRIIARSLAVVLDARFGCVTEVTEKPGFLKMLAFWTGEGYTKNFSYSIEGTPCENILGQSLVAIQDGVQGEYPKDEWLAEVGAESYIAVPLVASDGSALGHIGVVHDAPIEPSEEKVAVLRAFATRAAGELEQQARHARTQRVFDAVTTMMGEVPVGILRVERDGKISFASLKLETMFGYGRNELLGRPVEVLVPGELRRRHAKHRERFMRARHFRPMENDLDLFGRRKDGSTFPVGIALAGEGGGAIAVVKDNTHSREEFRRAAQRQARLEAVVQAFPEMTFIIDGKGVYHDYETATGVDPYVPQEAFLGKSVVDVMPEALAREIMACIERTLKTRKMHRLEYQLELPDGPHSYECRLVRLGEDRVAAFVRDRTAEEWLISETGRKTPSESGQKTKPAKVRGNAYGLSYREFSVLNLLKGGTTDKEIASDLGISVYTVNKHVSNILVKMDAASRTEATIRALQEGLID